ncbi:phosphoadenosine phosphosulfate reductase [Planobispora rosea]|uniref:Phosphoadenosine phosphosulfate reductase n=1 Tax=Planobispora rosea TaxID=35762 RepID=A0A8J3WBD0_PLARO|nr:phosphoadenosine phosphosulfate reductase [Planobispora rosea]GGS74233.1 phosphoadenosine phosphosulfate reductase [Planobispora rosea]GIH81721.1 phosphoadenosine phosphosulfate reductase [Planobispora rosea]
MTITTAAPATPAPETVPDLETFSYGGGWQSTAALVLAARGELPFRTFLFANVSDDSEHPATLRYLAEHAAPFAAAHGIALHQLARIRRDGSTETLYGRLTKPESRSLPIPVRMSNGAPGTRSCTADFKIRVIGRWLKAHGATAEHPATIGIGISLDEIERANNRRCEPHERIVYPLLDLRIRRADCPRIIRSAGLPVPPKSSCWFCPLHRLSAWTDMRRTEPELFERACALEAHLNARRADLGKDPVWLTRRGAPLAEVVPTDNVLPLDFGDGACDSGWCFT